VSHLLEETKLASSQGNGSAVKDRGSWRLVLPAAILGCALAVAICYALYLREASQMERTIRDRESIRVSTFSELFGSDFHLVAHDVLALASGDSLQQYLASGSPADLDRAAVRARFFASGYNHVRFIDNDGLEVLRVDRDGQRLPPEKLQNDGDSAYFKRAASLAPGQVYLSALDLSTEDGRVEEPFKPTMRFACPVFDVTGRRRGVYIVNFTAAGLIGRLQGMDTPVSKRARLLNAGGYWLKAADQRDEWGFMFPERRGVTMARTDPALWARVSSAPEGQVANRGGLFTWRRLVPRDLVSGTGIAGAVTEDPYLVVASEIDAASWANSFRVLRFAYVTVCIAVVFLIALGSWFVCARRQARLEQDRFFTLSIDLLCISSADGYFKRVSSAVTGILGWSVKEFLSRPYIDFVHPDDHEATIAEVRKQVIEGKKVLQFENRFRASDGSWHVLSWRSIPFPGGLMYATARDVTELKQNEEHVRQLNIDLSSRASQLEVANHELEAFCYSVSHDLRAPLRHIAGFAGLLDKDAGDSLTERGRGHLAKIAGAAKKMGVLIDDLLLFSRMGRYEMHVALIDPNGVLQEVIGSLRPETEGRNIRWIIGKLPPVSCDASMLRQVFVNLVSNAVKYTGKRGTAEIEIGCKDAAEAEVIVFVRDNGVGFDMKYAHKLFGVFQRLHGPDEFEGTGIGLANVRRIIARHGGRTWAEGELGVGATVYFSLPRRVAGAI
jgi:PAS domain S-box-containing protein